MLAGETNDGYGERGTMLALLIMPNTVRLGLRTDQLLCLPCLVALLGAVVNKDYVERVTDSVKPVTLTITENIVRWNQP